jgi:hypothetical protein
VPAVGVAESPDDLNCGVDVPHSSAKSGGGRGILDGGEEAAAQQEAMRHVGAVPISPDDLAGVVDARCSGAFDAQGIIDGGVSATTEQKAVLIAVDVLVKPDDLAGIVDVECLGVAGLCVGQRIVEGGENAAAQKEAVVAGGVQVLPDDLTLVVHADCIGTSGGQGIVDDRVIALAQKKAVRVGAGTVPVRPDDLTHIVDALHTGARGPQRIDGGVSASTQEKAMNDGGRLIKAHDAARGVDAGYSGEVIDGQGIVQGGEGLDWHDPASSDGRSRAKGLA